MASKKTASQKYATKKRGLAKKADKLLQILVVKLNPTCICCGDPSSVAHHFIYKSQSNYLRYSIKNCVPLCFKCHFLIHHSKSSELSGLITLRKGKDWFNELMVDKNKLVKTNLAWYESKISILEKL